MFGYGHNSQAHLFGGSYSFVNAEAAAVVAQMSTPPSYARSQAIDTLVGALKSASLWSKLNLLYVLAAHHEQAARLNWISPTTFTLTAVNSPVFAIDQGFTGDGSTSYLDTAWDAATNATVYTQNSAHLGSYCILSVASSSGEWGTSAANYAKTTNRPKANGSVQINSTTALDYNSGTDPAFPKHITGVRTTLLEVRSFNEGTFVKNNAANSSAALSSSDWRVLAANSAFTSRQVSIVHNGSSLSDAEVTSMYAALHNYMIAVGADT